jgi:hypothetical protein
LRSAHARTVPNLALRGDNDHSFVEVRDGGGFRRQPVRLGVRGPARAQVLTGLQDGDQVLVTRAPAETTDAPAADASAAAPAAGTAPAGAMP